MCYQTIMNREHGVWDHEYERATDGNVLYHNKHRRLDAGQMDRHRLDEMQAGKFDNSTSAGLAD